MNPRIRLTVILVALGCIMAFLPEKENNPNELRANELLKEIQAGTHYISVDELAESLINQDQSVLLIDVRSPEEYASLSLPDAINIPFDDILSENWQGYLDQNEKKNILYSNGTMLAGQAWMLLKRLGYKNNYVLKGGMNKWYTAIINPVPPDSTASADEFANYSKRVIACEYFKNLKNSKQTNKLSEKKKRKKIPKGGCE